MADIGYDVPPSVLLMQRDGDGSLPLADGERIHRIVKEMWIDQMMHLQSISVVHLGVVESTSEHGGYVHWKGRRGGLILTVPILQLQLLLVLLLL